MSFLESLLVYSFWGNTVLQYIVAFCGFVVMYILLSVFFVKLEKWLKKLIWWRKNHVLFVILTSITKTSGYFLRAVILYFPLKLLHLEVGFENGLDIVFFTLFIIQIIRFSDDVLTYVINAIMSSNWAHTKSSKYMTSIIVKVFVWVIGSAILLINLGVEISPLLASFWIWGIAIAFALQNLLSDFFASFSILFDKPFKVGDFIKLAEWSWTVQKISFKSTRIKTIEWEELILPNKKVVESPINNFSGVQRRRVELILWVTYETSPALLRKIPSIVEQIIEWLDESYEFKRMVFKNYWAYSLDFQLVYYVQAEDIKTHYKRREVVNYLIFESFAEHKISFAYPTQLVHVENK